MRKVEATLGERGYPILIESGILTDAGRELGALGHRQAIVLTVGRVRSLYGKRLNESLARGGMNSETIEVPDREGAKTIKTYSRVMKELLAMSAGKDSLVIGFGGGCVGDLAGFVASTYMRGVRLVQIPTTLLAQVDSSIGGKTALNLPEAKNAIGTFYQPSLVISDVDLLKTLPEREVRCGVAELIKYGAIMDLGLLGFMEKERDALMRLESEALVEAVATAAGLKASIVSRDETESWGLRHLLNFGHTLGHALEAAMAYKGPSHGEAVAVGMVGEARLAAALGLCTDGEVERLERIISSYGLPTAMGGVDPERLMEIMGHDKKVAAGKRRFALPRGLGKGIVVLGPPEEEVREMVRGVTGN